MRKNVFGRKFKRDKNTRKALFKGLMSSLVLNESIKTTEEKAKAIKGEVEKLVTKANKEKGQVRHSLFDKYLTPAALQRLMNDIAPRFKERKGGYTRIIKIGNRVADNASWVMIQWVEGPIKKEVPQKEKKKSAAKAKVKAKQTPKAKTAKPSKSAAPIKKAVNIKKQTRAPRKTGTR